ncbi:hypothetical protein H0G86_011407 [Trichoderma simmonsii]|uniref:Pfs domain protein n=1 Tax=Trichoderma simmonsii TaxID=1491479 RepID=A0A8G0LPE3_9HYPO|nr:hypothetical protein H0G86_011407 [Trichoderma simmonsii]
MDWQSEWEEGGLQGPAISDLDVIHMGCQFEGTDIEDDTSSIELAHTTPPIRAQMEDSESCDQTDGRPVVEKSSSPESSTDSSGQGGEANTPTEELGLLNIDRDWTVPTASDPWTHLLLRNPESPEYIQKLYRHLPTAQVPSNSSAATSGIAAAHSDSGYASNPKDAPGATPKLQAEGAVLQSHNISSAANTSVYSDQSSEDARRTQEYIWEFTKYLYQRINGQLTSRNIEKAMELLPKLLEAYAKKIGQMSLVQINREIMYFVYKYRKLIPQLLKVIFEDDQVVIEREPDAELMSTNDKINLLWSKGSDTDKPLDPEGDLDLVAKFDSDDENDNYDHLLEGDFSQYRDAIIEHPSFNWLIQRLTMELNISPTNSYAMMAIHQQIEEGLRDDDGISSTVRFEVNCDILTFVQEQKYRESAADVIPNVVALTGTNATNVQISSPEQYLLQVWPTIGCHLLETIQGALRVYDTAFPFRNSVAYTYADGTKIKVSIGERTIRVETIGTAYAIGEIGEQIGWLATTLRSGIKRMSWDANSYISFCHPQIIGLQVKNNRNLHTEEDEPRKIFVCKVEVANDEVVPNLPSINGQCWMAMFNNPVVVKGYPINPRGEGLMPVTGLEISWNDLITFTQSLQYAIVGGKAVMKGFSQALIPTGVHDDIISWHYIVDESGARIPFGDPRIQQGMFVPPDLLGSARRHVLGWCTNAQNNIGSPNANYDIKGSGLSSGGGGFTFEALEISLGVKNCASVTSTLRRGTKDMPICKPPPLYRSLVQHVGQHYFTLYDVEERRGFLSPGLAVLLHLLLASLRWGEIENPHDFYTDAIERLSKIPLSTQGTQAAKQILYDSANWDIKLHLDDTDKYHLFKDRVQNICHLLEAAIEKANRAMTQGALKNTPKNILGGFDFMDIAVCRPLKPIIEKLQIEDHSTGWTDLADSLGALPLFGNNFGDLVKPEAGSVTKSCPQCGSEPSLPSGKNYLAVCVDVLKEIHERNNGCKKTTPWHLIDDLCCHIDKTDFEPCRCISSNRRGSNHDRVQAISSKDSFLDTASANPNDIDGSGAVIFGHKRIAHRWNKHIGEIFIRNSQKTATIKKGSSPSDSIQLQVQIMNTAVGVPPLSATQDGDSEANKSQLSDTVSSATPDTFTSSGASGVDSNNTTIEQQSRTSNSGSPKPNPAVVAPQIASVAPPIVSRKRYGRKVRDICQRAWGKLKLRKGKGVSG